MKRRERNWTRRLRRETAEHGGSLLFDDAVELLPALLKGAFRLIRKLFD